MERVPANLASPLIGRQRELAGLWSHFEAATSGRTCVVLITGEPGIGKTRLLDGLVTRAAQAGARVLRGSASEAEGMPPYLPFLEALGQHIRDTATDKLRAQTGALAAVLATILPELTLRLGELPSSYPLPPEQARMRLYEAVAAFLAAIAAPRALLLILDDLQWAEPATLDLLCYVARHQPAARLLILGAYREGQVTHHPAFERALAELNRLRVLSTISIGPLAEAEIAALAANYLGAPVDPAVSQLLFTHSEGNAFLAEELLRGWLETGTLTTRDGRGVLIMPNAFTLSPSIVSAVRQRLTRLPLEVVDLLRTAAIIGRTFDSALLAEGAGQELEAVESRLLEAGRARLIRADAVDTYTFSHDKIRECLDAEVTPTRRRRLHGFIGRALEARPEPPSAQRLAALTFHFARSGDRARGATYAQRAAEHARCAYAPAEAQTHYRAALDLIDPTDSQRGDLLIGLGEAAMLAGAEQEAVAAFEAAQAWFQQAGDPLAAARAAHRLGQAHWRREALPAARAAFQTALALVEGHPGRALVLTLVDLGSLLGVSLHQYAEGIAYGRRALELAQRLDDDRLIAAARRTLGNLLVRANDLTAGSALLEQALALAIATDDPIEAAECCACLTLAYFWQGAMRRCSDMLMQRLAFAQRCHDPYQLRHVYTWRAVTSICQGKWHEAEQALDQAQAIVEQLTSPEPRAYLHFVRGTLAYWRGAYAAAEARFQEAIHIFRTLGPGALVWYLGELGLTQVAQGKAEEARTCVDELEALLITLPASTMLMAEPLAHLTATALALGDQGRLARAYPQLAVFQGQFHDVLIDRLLGEIARIQGDWAAARAHLAAAEAIARREDLRWELAHTLEAQANLALAAGGPDSAAHTQELLAQALELFQRLGNASEERRLRDRLRNLARQHFQSARLPGGLSPREAEVLRLVAAGKRNRAIAEALVVSEKTVESHLTSIYGKIGADNRAAATAFAIRHGLV